MSGHSPGPLGGGTIVITTPLAHHRGGEWFLDYQADRTSSSEIEGRWWGEPAKVFGKSGSDECAFSWENAGLLLTLWGVPASGHRPGPTMVIMKLRWMNLPRALMPQHAMQIGSGVFGALVTASPTLPKGFGVNSFNWRILGQP